MKIKLTGMKGAMANVTKELQRQKAQAVEAEKAKLVTALANATPKDTGYAASRWKVEGNSITNDAGYLDELNAGSSKQAPAHFVETTLLANSNVIPNGVIVMPRETTPQ